VNTLRLIIDPNHLDTVEGDTVLGQAAAILRGGGLVALPTETVYGLGANALDAAAVGRIFVAKQRPAWDPVIVHISGREMLEGLVRIAPDMALRLERLTAAFWPGPLTLLLPRTATIPDEVTAGRPLVGIRMPAHPVALEAIRRAGVPIAAPSANLFGRTSPTSAAHVLEDLDGRIDAVLDAGPTQHGVESTVLDPSGLPMRIYREGAITAEQIRSVAGAVEVFKSAGDLQETPREALPSPGLGLRHYAPRARLILVESTPAEIAQALTAAAISLARERIGIMLPADIAAVIPGATIFRWGRWSDPEAMARELYAGLRELDAFGCAVILCPLPPDEGIGAAMRDRLRKAAYPSRD
jgi:L-threonylcarbamoyladenylate synthase